ncbi:MAG: hypothetical protein Q4C87_00430 [Actinomycetaceae bacterium]|nr:hypothetical protein [Actinomycetaceae bacterium]
MTTFPTITPERLQRWAKSRGISARYEGSQYLHCVIEGFPGIVKLDAEVGVLTVILTFYFPQGDAGLGSAASNPEKIWKLVHKQAMSDWAPREFYIPASEEDGAKYERQIDLCIDEGITECQLDELIPATVDALYAAEAFHPGIAEAIAHQCYDTVEKSHSLMAAWRQSIAERAPQTYGRPEIDDATFDKLAWWNGDQSEIGIVIDDARLVTQLAHWSTQINCSHRDALSVFSFCYVGLDIEVILGEGKIAVSHYRQLMSEAVRNKELQEYWAQTFSFRYTPYSLGMQENSGGVLLRYQYWQPAIPMTDKQLRAFIGSSISAIERQVNEIMGFLMPINIVGEGQ